MPTRRPELGAFLRARRDRLSPAQAGIQAFPGPRRVPGLRREELAVLAGLSPDYYSRLEQGRQAHVSDGVLDALARALRLDDVERAHLHNLAAPTSRGRAGGADRDQRPDPGLLRLMTALDHLPVLLVGHRSDVLARNQLLQTVLGAPLEPGTSFVEFLFTDPLARRRITNWDTFAAGTVAALRGETGRRPYDTRLHALVRRLRDSDADVERWWADHRVVDRTSMVKHVDHPVAGPLSFHIEAVSPPHDPDQRLVVYTVEPDSPTAHALDFLTGYTEPLPDTSHPSHAGRARNGTTAVSEETPPRPPA